MHGRGTPDNPNNRFHRLNVLYDRNDEGQAEGGSPHTQLFDDTTKSILSENDSPDLRFRFGLNPYRGCEHGCPYCYARPSHEYLGFSAGLDFESKIMVKRSAPVLLREALAKPKWGRAPILVSGNTDCYQPVERRLRLTRACLEVCADFLQPIGMITKNALIRRDLDVLGKLAAVGAVNVMITLTTLDAELAGKLEPRASTPALRLQTIRALSDAGIPVGVMMAPIIPGLNDREIGHVLEAAAAHGAEVAGWTLLRLAKPLDALFADWLERCYPDRKDKVLARIRDCRDGAINDTTFGQRMRGTGPYAEQIAQLFAAAERKYGLVGSLPPPSAAAFRLPPVAGEQLKLF